MKSHGVLLSAPMVLAYLQCLKTHTRRTKGLNEINEDPGAWKFGGFADSSKHILSGNQYRYAMFERNGWRDARFIRLPYGTTGDTLYFKETWKMFERDDDGRYFLHFRADDAKVDPTWWTKEDWTGPDPAWSKKDVFEKWQSSMFMPQLCARLRDIPITNVRVERLHDITEADALDEGVEAQYGASLYPSARAAKSKSYRLAYITLWDELNAKRGHAWDRNDWVFVYEFERYKKSLVCMTEQLNT